ncbi:MAG: TspO/MBR family protein [Pirellulaceae bacterium]
MNWSWCDALEKPAWTPEPGTIGLIWQILYPIIVVTFGYVFIRVAQKKLPWRVAIPFAINLIANLAFTPIQFGLKSSPGRDRHRHRVADHPWMMWAIWKHHRWVAVAQVPYLVWVSIATFLQFTITWNNR